MIKEKDIRTFIPFILVALSAFFLSGADLFQDFGSVLDEAKQTGRLIWLLISSDMFQAIVWILCGSVFFNAWKKNREKNVWYSDLYWQLFGVFFCWFILAIVRLWGIFHQLLWIQGMIRLFVSIFGLYVFNTLWRARKLLYYPPTTEEIMRKNAKFDVIIKLMKDEK